jgi:hypothetical protein
VTKNTTPEPESVGRPNGLPPLPPAPVHPFIITEETLASAGRRSEVALRRRGGILGGLSLGDPQQEQWARTAKVDPERPGFLTNGLPVLPPSKSEVANGIRYDIPAFFPSARGGRVLKRKSRRRGAEGQVTAVIRVHDQESTRKLRYDSEALCEHWRTTGTCADPRHRHSVRRDN